ncbi:DUF2185 domain-containing protein [Pseudomonas sp. IT-P44]|uniref:DUF4376 domain-containing protein n=1 Tax=Pseudomonas sp. IT-P44 TaxID=3026451 RepID=UPI0039DFA6CD
MTVYQQDTAGALTGPVELPPVPGAGVLIPAGFVLLSEQLGAPEPGKVWALIGDSVEQLDDHRGTVYETKTGASIQWGRLGALPETVTQERPPTAAHHWERGRWVLDPQAVHAAKVIEINQACEAVITGGFLSSALGESFQYSSQWDDQLNLTGAVLRGFDMPYACRDALGVKAFRLHTVAQLRQVGDDFTLFKLQLLQHANELKQQLDQALAAGDVDALEQVTWEAAQP